MRDIKFRVWEPFNKKIHYMDFAKEHVDDNGSNKLDNCVPSCKSCNSKKHNSTLEDWYRKDNKFTNGYSEDRLNKIHKWLNGDYLSYIEVKINNEITI